MKKAKAAFKHQRDKADYFEDLAKEYKETLDKTDQNHKKDIDQNHKNIEKLATKYLGDLL
jgi:hypothetical protein